METVETAVTAALTIMILSYVVGDNVLYRLAVHILVGVGAAFVVAVAIGQVLYPSLVQPLMSGTIGGRGLAFGLFGVLGCVFMLAKLLRRVAWLGNVAIGYIIGAGVGAAVGGALIGTLVPQALGSVLPFNPGAIGPGGAPIGPGGVLSNALIVASSVTVLLAFAYGRGARRGVVSALGSVGRTFLHIALGATFALVFIASASVLSALVRDWFVRVFGS
ncbi:MAG TPA: hypothetical protein VJ754_02705 [Anaerolineae bacterium]|nr:hypothetical protein [Anaerolineae bacterium]